MTPVLFVTGHRTDHSDRTPPRFPEGQVSRVRSQIDQILAGWGVGPGWRIITGGARGTDLLAAQAGLDRGAHVKLCLAMDPERFIKRSVATTHPEPSADWVAAFHDVMSRSEVEVLPREMIPTDPDSSVVFERTNDWMLKMVGNEDIHVLVVWSGPEAAGRPGGTAALIDRLEKLADAKNDRFRVVDPTFRRYEELQDSPGPKRILALDGGGIRGVITLEILAAVEAQLRSHLGDQNLVLAEYFDYIAGTSTGAIIATGLALGKPVTEISEAYEELGRATFKRSLRALRQLARYDPSVIREQLVSFFGHQIRLGDPRFKTLLLVVMHNSDTDSPWLLSNCTRAKYNQAERMLPTLGQDRNLDIPMSNLLRASTAAPTYFPPETIQAGRRTYTFQDGGVTAFNNPALIAMVMATLPAYQLRWRQGPDRLLVVSIGTGFSAALPRPRRNRLAQATSDLLQLAPVFMNGASFSQDLLCRVLGDCRFGPKLDREVGHLVPSIDQNIPLGPMALGLADPEGTVDPGQLPKAGGLFSYVRYDGDLSAKALGSLNIPEARWKEVRNLAGVNAIDHLQTIGRKAGADVDVETHFAGFLSARSSEGG